MVAFAGSLHATTVSHTARVSPGTYPTVTFDLDLPGDIGSLTVEAASGYAFDTPPSIATNPTGLWYAQGRNVFGVVFVTTTFTIDGVTMTAPTFTSSDVMIIGTLKGTGASTAGGSGVGGVAPRPASLDFAVPGMAVLGGSVGAVFEEPSQIWVMEAPDPDTVLVRVRFHTPIGTVTSATGSLSWDGATLGAFTAGSALTPNYSMLWHYTVATGTASQSGSIHGTFNCTVAGYPPQNASATSIIQKAFTVTLPTLTITGGNGSGTYDGATGQYDLSIPVDVLGACIFTPVPDIRILGVIEQDVNAIGRVVYQNACRQKSSHGVSIMDGPYPNSIGELLANGVFRVTGHDTPAVTAHSTTIDGEVRRLQFLADQTVANFGATPGFKTYLRLGIGNRPWKTHAINAWTWADTWFVSPFAPHQAQPIVVTGGANGSPSSAEPIHSGTAFNNLPWEDCPPQQGWGGGTGP